MKAIINKIKNILNSRINYQLYKNRDVIYFFNKEKLAYVYRKKYGLIKHKDEIETIAIGSSYADNAFFPNYIDKSYNLGLTSTDMYLSYQLLLKCKEMLPNLKNIVYFSAVFAPGMSLIKTKEKYRAIFYKYFFGIPYQEEGIIDKNVEKIVFKKCKNIKENIPNDYSGYETMKTYMIETTAEVRSNTILRENRREPDQMMWIKKTIDQVIEDKKNIFIVIPPYSTELKNILPPKEELYKKAYDQLNDYEGITNVQLIDMYDSDLFDDSDMGDNDHLNEKGAKKCTMRIKEYIDKIQ